jgi:hypothetical protein
MWATKRTEIHSSLADVVSSQAALARLNARATQALAAAEAALDETQKALRLFAPFYQAIVHGREEREEKIVQEEDCPIRGASEFKSGRSAMQRWCLLHCYLLHRAQICFLQGHSFKSNPTGLAHSSLFVPHPPPADIAQIKCMPVLTLTRDATDVVNLPGGSLQHAVVGLWVCACRYAALGFLR